MALPTKKTVMAQQLQDNIILIYGPPGVGKTTLVDQLAERVLFLSTDRGTRSVKTMRVECFKWQDFEQVLKDLRAPDAPKYDIVCIDHVDDMASIADDQVCKDLKVDSLGDDSLGFGKGWRFYRKKMENYVRALLQLGVGVVFIAHEEVKAVKTSIRTIDRTTPSMPKSASKFILPMCDLVAYCGQTTKKGEDGKKHEIRIIRTQPSEAIYAKDRTLRQRPANGVELLDGKAFAATFEGASNGKVSSTQRQETHSPSAPQGEGASGGGVGRRARR